VSELFELSKLDARESLPEMEPVALGELVMDVVQKFRLRAGQQGIKLDTHIGEGLPFVVADIAMLDRVLENLVGNAIDHCDDGGTILLELQGDNGSVRLAVCNSGEVINAADMPHLFERFYQSPQNRHGKGAGLGLAIVRRIVELHGSDINVARQDNLNCFYFTLPLWKTTH
jgi:signal transduction histidine kinase